MSNSQKIKEFLERWMDKVYPSKEAFRKALRAKKLTIYHGVDPTAPHLHLGHSTNLLLLRELQKLGHKIILLIGDFTAQIGDPTGRVSPRRALSRKNIFSNYKTYKKQAGKILDFTAKKNPSQIKFNSQWLDKIKLEDILKLTANFTVAQIIKRNMFQERIKKKEEIYLHEFLYPLFQGYDSVALDVDVEIGGTDQTFNMLVGRDLMRIYKNKEKFVVTTPLLINPRTGKKLMSKSEGGVVALDDSPEQMYGKIMALPDEVIIVCFKLCTRLTAKEISQIELELKKGLTNPRDAKARLGFEIVKLYHKEKKAKAAAQEFDKVFKQKELPSRIPQVKIKKKQLPLLDLLVKTKLAPSKAEAKRLIEQGGVKINNQVIKDWQEEISIRDGMIVQVGKRKFVKLSLG